MSHSKRGAQAIVMGIICVFLGMASFEINRDVAEREADEKAPSPGRKRRNHR